MPSQWSPKQAGTRLKFQAEQSFSVRDEASDARRIVWRRFTGEGGMDGVVEFVRGSGVARVAEVFIPVIDAAVVDQPVMRVENCSFGCDLNLRLRDKCMLRVAQRGELVAIFAFVLANFFRRGRFPKIDKPKARLTGILRADSLNQQRITVGDGTICA